MATHPLIQEYKKQVARYERLARTHVRLSSETKDVREQSDYLRWANYYQSKAGAFEQAIKIAREHLEDTDV